MVHSVAQERTQAPTIHVIDPKDMVLGSSRPKRRTSAQHLNSPSRAGSTTSKNLDINGINFGYSHENSSFEEHEQLREARSLTLDTMLRIIKRRLRPRPLAAFIGLAVLLYLLYTFKIGLPSSGLHDRSSETKAAATDGLKGSPKHDPPNIPPTSHPMWSLITSAENEFENMKQRQSKTLSAAVAEYRRRYGIAPPPNFDKWYNLAVANNYQLIDEFDVIHQTLTPFWGLEPGVIRSRAREALGFDNNLLGVLIRGGKITKKDGGRAWQHESIDGMTEKFLQYLPDMDLCFNVYDEPRVILPHDDLARLVARAKDVYMAAAMTVNTPRNTWSKRPGEMNDGTRIDENRRTRFNYIVHQATWSHSRLSCPPNSPARSIDEDPQDDIDSYAVGELGFIYNHTAFSDICSSPSFRDTYGFFDAPNSFSVAQDLFPIFSPSKISSFQDIVFPSFWYWYNKVKYNELEDPEWRQKEDKMYWRGSTNGGYARDGGWRRQHRQQFVQKINFADYTKILQNTATGDLKPNWTAKNVFRPDYAAAFDIKFSEINQCDPGDCKAQKEVFEVASPDKQDKAWKYKYLVDIDGNAFSGRFYAFLMSKSLVYKLAIFREWHTNVLMPWVHYVPLSLRGNEHLEAVRWFSGDDEGKKEGERIAASSRDWAGKVLRNVDLELWLFRLLLE